MNMQNRSKILNWVKSLSEVIRKRLESSETSEITKTQILFTFIVLLTVVVVSFA